MVATSATISLALTSSKAIRSAYTYGITSAIFKIEKKMFEV